MRSIRIAAAIAVIGGGLMGSASADDRPVFPPSRDVAVTYKLLGAGRSDPNAPSEFHMTWSASAHKMRMDIGPNGYMLMDMTAKSTVMVMTEQRMVMTLPPGTGPAAMFNAANGPAPARKGTETIAGLTCTVWENKGAAGRVGTACVTADGVMLRALGTGPNGQSGGLEATEVRYTTAPASTFVVPKDYQTMAMPGLRPPGK